MAISGAKPKEDRTQIRHRVPPAAGAEWVDVDDVPFDGPPLGDRPESAAAAPERPMGLNGELAGWPKATLRWWEAVRTMPHAKLWTESEWETARGAAEAHARFVEGWKGCASGAELRQREKALGMTRDSRRDLRIRYVEPKAKPDPNATPAGVTNLDDYRDL